MGEDRPQPAVNALKFTFDGAIGVALGAEDTHAVLRVADTGTGVAAGEMPRLFERFHRIPNARSRSNEGSGIGLALVRELIGLHGGTITAESTEGAGTAFTVRLPLGHDHLPEVNVAPAAGPGVVSAVADPFVEEALRWLPGGEAPAALLPPAARLRPRPSRARTAACCSRTTTPTCASTCTGCCGPATR